MPPVIVWFRQDLRLNDQRALAAACASGSAVIPLYILDDETPGKWRAGSASRWWLNRSLAALAESLEKLGSRLVLRSDRAIDALQSLARESGARTIYTQAAYEPWASADEDAIHSALGESGVELKRMAGATLARPGALRTQSGQPFKVYTPFWRALKANGAPPLPLPAPRAILSPVSWPKSERLSDWKLHPEKPDWSQGFSQSWAPGEAGAHERLATFLDNALHDYGTARNRPDKEGTSRLSPHLHFGEVSAATCWHAAVAAAERLAAEGRTADQGLETFLKELTWRDFSANLIVHWPALPDTPFKPEFSAFPWKIDDTGLKAWQRGKTGYPIVDAGMRELWHTGWMHNRVRMVVASFLVKDLLIPWQHGEAWFWDTLVDADLANNAASWQWVAGCGADAAPYFRIFNPVKQGETFDPDGAYVRRWVPELDKLPAAHIHEPWTAPPMVLASAGVTLGRTYPLPIVDHAMARDRALAALKSIKT